jgi:hypothetical protein
VELVVRPFALSGRSGEFADIDLMRARRAMVEELILMSLQFSVHTEHVRNIAVDWSSGSFPRSEAVTAITARGCELPPGDWRIRALRAVSCEAIMTVCDA